MLNLLISGKFFENGCFYKDIQIITFRRKQLTEVLYKETALKNFLIFTGTDICWSLFEITLRHGCSPVYLLHIFRMPFLKNTSGQLLLDLLLESYHWLHFRYLLHVSFVSSDKTWVFPFNDFYILIKSSVSVVSDAEQYFNLWPSLRPYPLLTTLLVTKSIHSCKINSRSNLPKVFCKKSVLKNFANISGKKTCQSLFYKKVASL